MADLQKLARRTLIFAVPMACVVVIQVHSSPLSPWNRGSGDTPETIYFVPNTIGDYIRPAGTFTSSLGFTAFVVSAVSLALGVWLSSSSRIMKRHWLVVGTIAIAACLTLSGSRGAMVWSGVVVIAAGAILSLANPQMGFKAIVITCMLAGAGVTLATVFFPDATAAFVQRWTSANEAEAQIYGSGGVFSRAVDEIVRFHILLPGRPSLGYGLGSAGNAAWTLGTRNQSIPFYNDREVGAAEVDWGRNVLELGPIVGVAFIVFRVAFVIWLAKEAFVATQRSGNPLPWMLWTFVSVLLSYGQITAHGTLNGYGWLFTGFCLAAVYQTRGTRSFRPA